MLRVFRIQRPYFGLFEDNNEVKGPQSWKGLLALLWSKIRFVAHLETASSPLVVRFHLFFHAPFKVQFRSVLYSGLPRAKKVVTRFCPTQMPEGIDFFSGKWNVYSLFLKKL